MMEFLSDIDTKLFLIINGCNHPMADFIMFWISSRVLWFPLYAWLLWLLWKKNPGDLLKLFVAIFLLILLTDQGSVMVKNVVERLRPCHALGTYVHLVNDKCGGQFGFVSSHATNTMGIAIFVSLLLKNRFIWFGLISWAVLVSYSRVYLGVHYPGDVLGGILLGAGLGYVVYLIYVRVRLPIK